MRKLATAALLLALGATAQPLRAGVLDNAIEDYNGGKYQRAAIWFYQI
jgi:hypothetical protein